MSMPLDQQQQPPPMATNDQAYSSHSGSGSVGPVIGVLAVILVLGVIAGMIGRLCSGRRIMGHGQYNFEGWIERKCASCIDGRVEPPPNRNNANANANASSCSSSSNSVPIAIPVENASEIKQAEQSPQNTAAAAQS